MFQAEFNYNGIKTNILCNSNDKIGNICKEFAKKEKVDINSIYFIYSGSQIDRQSTLYQTANSFDKIRNQMNILVYSNNISNENKSIVQSKQIICPKCGENSKIEIKDYKISLFECKNGHKINNMLLDEFENSQKIDLSKIICDSCKNNNMGECFNNTFFRCCTCKINLCPLCKDNHIKGHNIINYEESKYICDDHREYYYSYCKTCKKNLCTLCENNHNNHEIIYFGQIIQNKDDLKNELNDLRKRIDKFNDEIIKIINILNKVKENMEVYYKIKQIIINNIENKNRNYEILYNLMKNSHNNDMMDINNVINDESINNKFNILLNLYKKMINEDNEDEIRMIYKINKNESSIRILGSKFVENNKDYCKIIYNDNEYELDNEFNINDIDHNDEELEIKLKGIKNITNMSSMFCMCKELISLPDISKIDTTKVTDMSGMFDVCSSLSSLPDISNWNTSNVTNMSGLFHNCSSLISLPDISKWNTSNVTNMSYIFSGCKSLESLPDISKWNISNVTKKNKMFDSCNNNLNIPDKFKN